MSEPVTYTYTDDQVRSFTRKNIKGMTISEIRLLIDKDQVRLLTKVLVDEANDRLDDLGATFRIVNRKAHYL